MEDSKAARLVALLHSAGVSETVAAYANKQVVFAQGSPADTVCYLERGFVKVTVVSRRGEEAVTSILSKGSLIGEGGIAGQEVRTSTVVALTACSIIAFDRTEMSRAIRERPDLAQFLISYLVQQNAQIEADLVDQLLNSSEKRLARAFLRLGRLDEDGPSSVVIPRIDQETLAQLIGTTRSRVSFFMSKFRRSGFIDNKGGLRVHRSLWNVLRHN